MEERELVSLIEKKVSSSIGNYNGDLSESRAKELKYYYGEPFGNEIEGESQVVSTDVFDTVEGMLPDLLDIFFSSDDVVMFNPVGAEDEEKAKQRTDVCNYVLTRQNNGFLVFYEWFKDALLQKNGVVKYWWEEDKSYNKDSYQGLTEGQYLKLSQDDAVEITAHTEYEDKSEMPLREMALQEFLKKAPPQFHEQIKQQIMGQPLPKLHDVEVKVLKDRSRVCIECVPPEEFGIDAAHKCVSIQETNFCYHKNKQTISSLRAKGCPEEVLIQIGSDHNLSDLTAESLARDKYVDQQTIRNDDTKDTHVTECFIRVDMDNDGVDELRHVILVDRAVWIDEETDHINFAAITPIIMPHRWIGRSAAELVMEDQFTKSVLIRQMLNNLYLTNNPRKVVLSSPSGVVQANLDDMYNSRPGAIAREYVPNAIRNEETPFVAGAAFPMLEYIDGQKEVRTGVTRYSQGTDADSLNKTARGIGLIQQAGQKREKLIARIFAETGVKDLMKGIAYMLSKYSTKAMTIKLRNQWVDIDPREWEDQYDMVVNVGLGTGNKDQQLAHLNLVDQSQLELMKTGRGYLVTDENVFNLHSKRAETMGFKNPEMFISSPNSVQKPPPAPNPDLLKIQQADKEATSKLQSNEKIRQFDAQTQKELETIKAQGQAVIEQMKLQAMKEIEAMKIQAQQQLEVFRTNATLKDQASALEHGKLQLQVDRELHNISKQVAQNAPEPVIDQTAILEAQIKKETELEKTNLIIAKDIKVAEISANATAAAQPTTSAGEDVAQTSELLDKVNELSSAVSELSKANQEKQKPRKHTVTPKGDGSYEITTVH